MQAYKEFRPTEFDTNISLPDRAEWLVLPLQRNRDSVPLDESNFHVALERLGGESEAVEVHRFGHWACGWLEIILVNPRSKAAATAQELADKLLGYPVLSEEDFYQREHQLYSECWERWGRRAFVDAIIAKFNLSDEQQDAIEARSSDELLTFFEDLNPSGCYHEDGEPVIRRSVDQADLEDVEAFLAQVSTPPGQAGMCLTPAPGHLAT